MDNDIVFGRHSVEETLQQKRGNKLFIQESLHGAKIDRLKTLAKQAGVPVVWVPKVKLDQLTQNGQHQGIVLTVSPYEYLTLEALLNQTLKEDPVFLILDRLEDPHNFGSILRTADATQVDGIIIPKHRASAITPIVTKTSTGAVEHLPIARVTNLAQAISKLKDHGFWVYGTDMKGTDMRDWNVTGPIALIIGNEGKGISPNLKKAVDEAITIPMSGHVQSLNASVAAGVLMYEIYRKRQK